MRDLKKQFIDILRAEVKPAVGCTEPVAVALACAKAAEILKDRPDSVEIKVSPSIFKNGMGVGIPGTKRIGLKIAAAIGIIGGKSSKGLSVLEGVDSKKVAEAEDMMDSGIIDIEPAKTTDKVFIDVRLKSGPNTSRVRIKDKHDNIVFVVDNDKVIFGNEDNSNPTLPGGQNNKPGTIFDDITLEEIVKNVEGLKLEDIDFLLEGIKMNEDMANVGLDEKIGIGVGYGMKKSIASGMLGDDVVNNAMMMTAAASDARMSGVDMPVMSSNGSGNHGLTAILPIAAYLEKFPQDDESACKALAISHLVTAYIKNFTGRLSAMCGCGVAASTGASAGLAWLMGHDIKRISGAVNNMIADMSGMICDGAKAGCAIKLSSAASAAVQNAILASNDCVVGDKNGIVSSDVDKSIRNLGKVSEIGMTVTDETILDVMNNLNKSV